MFRPVLTIVVIVIVMIVTGNMLGSVELLENGKVVIPDKISAAITIDGELAEAVWQQTAINREFKTVMPGFGKPLGQETRVWAAYDKDNLYFAFRCFDTQPDKIKTSIAQRDKIQMDDFVGVLLDGLGNRQGNYGFYVNPSGIQMDLVGSAVSKSDIMPDFVWESAGKLTPDGYQVELRIPLESIRYKSGKGKENQVKMGIVFYRSIPHLGVAGFWPELQPGQTLFNVMSTIIYKGLKKSGLRLEILPNFTYSSNSERKEAETWEKSTDTNLGLALKYGVTSSITMEATVNPDFSQVESDVFQVEVNQRYPIFYQEKRPFFMESQEVLDFTIVHDAMASVLEKGMMISPIHTRRIVDPGWAVKLSGSSGKLNFAFLAANDRSAGRAWENSINPNEGKSALFGIFRAKYNLGSDNSLGVLYTGRHFEGQSNDVGGIDLKYRFSKHIRASLSYLHSVTKQTESDPLETGDGWNAIFQYITPRAILMTSYERYSREFFMASAFQNRVGISRWWFGFGPYINTRIKPLPWLKRLVPYIHYSRLHDLGSEMNDISRVFGLYMNFSPKGDLYLEYRVEDEAWQGRLFDKNYFYALGYIQLSKWLYFDGQLYIGGQIYYDITDPFLGNDRTINIGLTMQPGIKLKLGLDYLRSDFKDKQTKQKVYTIDIYNLHTTYQFNKYFFLRGIVRYDSLQEKLLTDILASFTLIPGTVVHLGYGSLYLRNQWQGNMWVPGQGDLVKMREGIFFKASYLWRFK